MLNHQSRFSLHGNYISTEHIWQTKSSKGLRRPHQINGPVSLVKLSPGSDRGSGYIEPDFVGTLTQIRIINLASPEKCHPDQTMDQDTSMQFLCHFGRDQDQIETWKVMVSMNKNCLWIRNVPKYTCPLGIGWKLSQSCMKINSKTETAQTKYINRAHSTGCGKKTCILPCFTTASAKIITIKLGIMIINQYNTKFTPMSWWKFNIPAHSRQEHHVWQKCDYFLTSKDKYPDTMSALKDMLIKISQQAGKLRGFKYKHKMVYAARLQNIFQYKNCMVQDTHKTENHKKYSSGQKIYDKHDWCVTIHSMILLTFLWTGTFGN